MNAEKKNDVRQLRNNGASYQKIADLLGLSVNTVKSFCQRNGIAPAETVKSRKDQVLCRCKQCNCILRYTAGKKKKLYCSDSCRSKWWNAHTALISHKQANDYICAGCGKAFQAFGAKPRKYCSIDCYRKSRSEQKSGTEINEVK